MLPACVMNVISFEKAYSLFPRGTLEERRSLICATDGPGQTKAIEKYEQRGWTMVYALDDSDMAFSLGPRWISDDSAWTISLNTTDVINPYAPLPIDPVVGSNWEVARHPIFGGVMDFTYVWGDALRYRYVSADMSLMHYLEELLYAVANHLDDTRCVTRLPTIILS